VPDINVEAVALLHTFQVKTCLLRKPVLFQQRKLNMTESRIYQGSAFPYIRMFLVFVTIFVVLFFVVEPENRYAMIALGSTVGIILIFMIFSMLSRATISDDEISTQNLLGTKTLRWSEINQVSGRGYAIKLRDTDRNLTVAPTPQLSVYEKLIDWIGVKRPDLFNYLEYNEMS
jgi:hypothetical protein